MSNFALSKRAFVVVLFALYLIGMGSSLLESQTTATVSGTVADSSGALVPNALVRVKNAETGVTHSAVTDDEGRFRFLNLSIGTYDVEASKTGFKTFIRRPVTLGVGNSAIVDFSLEVGQPQETIFVEAAASLVETHSPAVSSISTFDQKQLQNLPLDGRNLSELVTMNPGVAAAMGSMSMGPGSMGMNMLVTIQGNQETHSISGARTEGQAILLDNTNVQGFWNHGMGSGAVGSSLGIEAVANLQVLTSSYDARFGGNGSVANAVTKSGTNAFHGSVYEYLRNSALNARNFFDTTADPPPFRRNQFGASLGGPLQKDKLFFFFNYEGLRQAQSQTATAFVPDSAARQGILPGLSTPITIHPSIQPILDLYPLPNGPNIGGGVAEYRSAPNSVAHEDYFMGRVDWVISTRDSLFARYVSDRGDFVQPFAGSTIPLWPEQDKTANQYFTVEGKRIFSPFLANALRFSFVRPVETGGTTTRNDALQFFPGSGREDALVEPGGGVSAIGSNISLPFTLVQNRFTYADDVTWVRGAHTFHFGASIERLQSNTNIAYFAAGDYSFNNLQDFLTGRPVGFFGVAPGNGNGTRDFRETSITPYFHDDWKVRPRLTLNIGLRYDYGTNPVGVRHPLYTIVDPPNSTAFEQVTHVFKSSPNKQNWDPRFGFAWDPFEDHKTSVRGGFGVYHSRIAPRTYVQAFAFNPPFSVNFRFLPSFPNPFPTLPPAPPPVTTNKGVLYDLPSAPYQMEWSLNLQREVLNSVITLGYVGTRGVHLLVMRDLNPPTPIVGSDGLPRYGTQTPFGVSPNPRINPASQELSTLVGDGNSSYNSLQISFDRRVTRNLNAMVSYTWSKCIDNGSSSFAFEEKSSIPYVNVGLSNPYDARADRGNCTFVRRHSFRGAAMLFLPFEGNRFVEGWVVSPIVMANSGRPFSVTDGFNQAGFANPLFASRPDAVVGCEPILGKVEQWYDPACFRLQSPGRPGNLGRNTLTGPGMFTTDIALIKNIPLRESVSLQFRTEAYNIFNHANFGLPNTDLFVPDGTGGGTVSPTAGRITATTTSARQIQFAVKFLF